VPALYTSGGFVKGFADARGGSGAVRCQLCSPGGSVSCSQMPEGGLLIVWQLGASSVCLWRAREGICRCQRGCGSLCDGT
jgi:hypothetical protein